MSSSSLGSVPCSPQDQALGADSLGHSTPSPGVSSLGPGHSVEPRDVKNAGAEPTRATKGACARPYSRQFTNQFVCRSLAKLGVHTLKRGLEPSWVGLRPRWSVLSGCDLGRQG